MSKLARSGITLLVPALLLGATAANGADLKLDGFGSMYYGQAFNSNLLPYGFSSATGNGGGGTTGTSPDFTDFSLVGTDIHAKIDDQWSGAAELIAEGQTGSQSNYTLFAQWAYINYTPMEGLSIKVGRQRYPIWTASEYINNHFELPYRVMPAAVYQLSPFASFDGASVTETMKLNDSMKGSLQVFGGAPILGINVNSATATFTGDRLIGARVNVEGDGWRVRAQASRLYEQINWSSTYSPAFGSQNSVNSNIFTVGYRFDKWNIVSWGEFGYTYANDAPVMPNGAKALQNGKAGYGLIGYRIDKWLPRYTFAKTNLNSGFESGTLTTHTFGVNYQVSDHVIVKAEYELDVVPTPGGGPAFIATQPTNALGQTTTTDTSGSAFYIGADFQI